MLYAAGAAFSIAIIGFYFVPTHAIDLTRYYQIIEQYQYMMPTYADIVRSQGFFVGAGTLFKWVATLGNEQLLPAFVGFISSFSYFYISGDYFAFRKVAPLTRVYLLLIGLCLFPFAAAFSNVRNVTACTIVAIALYRDLVKKDRGIVTWCIYALGVSFHIAVLAILLMRVVLFFRQSQHIRVKLLSIIAILTGLAFPQIRNTLMQFFGKGGSYATLNEGAYVTDIGQSLFFWLTKVLFLGVTLVGFLVVMGNYKRNKSDWNFFALILSMCTL
ncbi:hypothetical protein, partial [Lactiplantibacillus garii]|uniref:hypothetical protein n=1 Tax=Lactiplantibacillus garii TaxID=2306423 RepID=UPI0011CFBDA0